MNKLTPEDIEFVMRSHLSLTNEYAGLYRCDKFGLQMEIHTKRKKNGEPGSSKQYYFIDNNQKEYTNLSDLCDDWNEMHSYDETDSEITWIKVIKKKPFN